MENASFHPIVHTFKLYNLHKVGGCGIIRNICFLPSFYEPKCVVFINIYIYKFCLWWQITKNNTLAMNKQKVWTSQLHGNWSVTLLSNNNENTNNGFMNIYPKCCLLCKNICFFVLWPKYHSIGWREVFVHSIYDLHLKYGVKIQGIYDDGNV